MRLTAQLASKYWSLNPTQLFVPSPRRPMKHLHLALVLTLLLLLWPLSAGAAPTAASGAMAGELIVKLRPGLALDSGARALGRGGATLDALLRRAGAGAARSLGAGSDTYRVRVR